MPEVDPLEFRRVAGRFATGITVVTTRDPEGADHAMTVNSFASVSLDPLLVLFCCEKIARFHEAVVSAERWGVSVLGADQEKLSTWFALRGRPFEGQFDGVSVVRGEASGALLIADALATLECATVGSHDGGDHTIIVGSVLAVSVPRSDGTPLLYYEGRYREIR